MATAACHCRTINNNGDGQLLHMAAGRGNSYWRAGSSSLRGYSQRPPETQFVVGDWFEREKKNGGLVVGGCGCDPGYEDMIKYAIKRAQDKSRRDCDSPQTFPAWCALPAHVAAVRRRNYESAINPFSCRRAERGGTARLLRWFLRVQSLNF